MDRTDLSTWMNRIFSYTFFMVKLLPKLGLVLDGNRVTTSSIFLPVFDVEGQQGYLSSSTFSRLSWIPLQTKNSRTWEKIVAKTHIWIKCRVLSQFSRIHMTIPYNSFHNNTIIIRQIKARVTPISLQT